MHEVIVIIVLRVINDKVLKFRLLGTTIHVQFGILPVFTHETSSHGFPSRQMKNVTWE